MLSSWASLKLWPSIFLDWMSEHLLVKYGGLNTYRRAKPILLSLVSGEMTSAAIWVIIGMLTGVSTS